VAGTTRRRRKAVAAACVSMPSITTVDIFVECTGKVRRPGILSLRLNAEDREPGLLN
jgi:hypothetical protein